MDAHPTSDVTTRLQERFTRNIKRCGALLEVAGMDQLTDDVDSCTDDLLRSVVVLAHATLEDLLRTVHQQYFERFPGMILTQASSDEKKEVLLRMQGLEERDSLQSIGALLTPLIRKRLQFESFSDTDQICRMLDQTGISVPDRDQFMPRLAELIARRHQIVHNADILGDSVDITIAMIDSLDVELWLSTVGTFGEAVIGAYSSWATS